MADLFDPQHFCATQRQKNAGKKEHSAPAVEIYSIVTADYLSMDSRVVCGFAPLTSDSTQTTSPWFALVSKDQRVKIWNTATSSLHLHLTEPQHLGSVYTCVAMSTATGAGVRFLLCILLLSL